VLLDGNDALLQNEANMHFSVNNLRIAMFANPETALLNLVQRFPKMKLTGQRPEWASTIGKFRRRGCGSRTAGRFFCEPMKKSGW
jgi:hypothetical protein